MAGQRLKDQSYLDARKRFRPEVHSPVLNRGDEGSGASSQMNSIHPTPAPLDNPRMRSYDYRGASSQPRMSCTRPMYQPHSRNYYGNDGGAGNQPTSSPARLSEPRLQSQRRTSGDMDAGGHDGGVIGGYEWPRQQSCLSVPTNTGDGQVRGSRFFFIL